jgi:RNA polymerase sigma-70 factor (ECF subfamily)
LEPTLFRIFQEHYPILLARCARILGETPEAEDVAQETFLRFHRAGLATREPAARLAWIYRTSTRLAIDVWRRRRAGVEVASPEDGVDGRAGAERIVAARRSLETLRRRLPADELEVAVLSRIDGLDQREIATVTGWSERTVRRLLERLDRRLARLHEEVSP